MWSPVGIPGDSDSYTGDSGKSNTFWHNCGIRMVHINLEGDSDWKFRRDGDSDSIDFLCPKTSGMPTGNYNSKWATMTVNGPIWQ